ncbi:heme-binding domain-containing protein [Maribacter sp. ANRC-HE7]|uniref:Heme-binding domain-containing protein n=1 Tax=Maribacter aquimaris TaxID=2737171 RepID=A0ABR7UZN6_9FLAO|nr:heme-binding domain-containing protein [Maribacter aquimaris]MBD0776881.1 heme-binding domain-containing protein [Maribacter aquimaris]
MKILRVIAWIALVAFIVIQFFPTEKNTNYTTPKTDFMVVNNVPSKIENQLKVSCYDCHSNNTEYPCYNKIQPVAWYLKDHVKEGKAELNFNEWGNYSDRRKNSKLRSIIKQIENGEMPMDSYTLMHRDAMLSKYDKNNVIAYITRLKDSL